MSRRPTVEYDGKVYSLRSVKTAVPDLGSMERMHALVWLMQNTTPRGYSRPKPGLPPIDLTVR